MLSLRRALAMVVAVGMTGLAGLGGCAPAGQTPAYMPPADLSSLGLKQLWERRVTLAPHERVANTWRVGDSIYIATSQARVIRINATSGTLAWDLALVDQDYRIFRPAEVPGGAQVLIVTSGEAFLVDKDSGNILQQKRLDIAVTTDPIVPGGNVFCVGGVNYFYAIYLDTLQGRRWVTAAKNDVFTARPAVQGDSALLATEQGKLFRISLNPLNGGDWIWRDHKTNGRVIGGLAADARAVYVPCLDGNVYAFDMANGFELWNHSLKGELSKNLMLTRSDVLVPTGGDNLYCLSTARGDVRWEAHNIRQLGTPTGGKLWVVDSAGSLEALSLETGEAQGTAPISGASLVINPTDDHTVVLVNKAGVVAAYTTK